VTDPQQLPQPDAICDGGDLDCGSGLLLIIRGAMAPLRPGGVLEVRSREISVKEDLPAWCRLVGHALLDAAPREGGCTSYLLRKKHDDAELQDDLAKARQHQWQARVRWDAGMQARATVRNHAFAVGQPASFDTADEAPSAVEFLLAALAAAICTGLQWRLSRQGITMRNLEVTAKGRSADILAFLGMSDGGNPGLDGVDVAVYVDADADEATVDGALADTVERCPVLQSLRREVPVRARWRGV
jgi:uncharacterized OsmC-like protein/TusA-related sulfurtransferase